MTTVIIIGIYFAILLGLGIFSSRLFRGTSLDYLLASHSIGPFLLLMSLFGTTMTAFSMVGSTGEAFRTGIGVYGLMASSSALLHPLCFFLVGVKVWSLARQHGYSTQIQFFEERLESRHFGKLLFPVLVSLVIPYVLIGILGGGATLKGATRGLFETAFAEHQHAIPPWLGSLVICGVVMAYVFVGGMRGTAWANAFQTTVFMVLGLLTFFVLVKGIGQQDGFLDSLKAASAAVPAEKASRSAMPHASYFAYLLVPFSLGMFPHIFQHWLTARDANAFKLPIIAHPLFVAIVWAPCVLIGAWASADGTGIPGLIESGKIRETAILAVLVSKHSSEVLSGLLTAGILAAIMSSLDSQFLCLGTMFTKDVLGKRGDAPEDDVRTVFYARCFVVGVVTVCYLLSLVVPAGVFHLGVWCFSGFAALFPLIVAALYWRGLTAAGAYASVLTTAVLWSVLFYQSRYGADPGYVFLGVDPIVTLFAGSLLTLIGVSLVTRRPSESTLRKFFPDASRVAEEPA